MVSNIEIGLQFEVTDFVPPLEIGNTFAYFSWEGNLPYAKLFLISRAIDGDKIWPAILIILDPDHRYQLLSMAQVY